MKAAITPEKLGSIAGPSGLPAGKIGEGNMFAKIGIPWIARKQRTGILIPLRDDLVGTNIALLLVVAVTFGAHPLLSLLLRGSGGWLLRHLGPAGRLARDHCERAAGPTSLTVVAITLSFGLVYSTDVLVKSYEGLLNVWFDDTVGEDLFVIGEDFLSSGLQGSNFDIGFADELRRVPGVLHVNGEPAKLEKIDDRYLIVIEGMASKDGYAQNDELSYRRSLALARLWERNNVSFDPNICELQIAGSGTKGIGRFSGSDEVKNQRFLIQIVPKIGDIGSK